MTDGSNSAEPDLGFRVARFLSQSPILARQRGRKARNHARQGATRPELRMSFALSAKPVSLVSRLALLVSQLGSWFRISASLPLPHGSVDGSTGLSRDWARAMSMVSASIFLAPARLAMVTALTIAVRARLSRSSWLHAWGGCRLPFGVCGVMLERRHRLHVSRRRVGACLKCGHSRSGIVANAPCPECGASPRHPRD